MANRQNGPEQVMQMAEERAPGGFERVEDVIDPAELESMARILHLERVSPQWVEWTNNESQYCFPGPDRLPIVQDTVRECSANSSSSSASTAW
jgi:hypothetical protein